MYVCHRGNVFCLEKPSELKPYRPFLLISLDTVILSTLLILLPNFAQFTPIMKVIDRYPLVGDRDADSQETDLTLFFYRSSLESEWFISEQIGLNKPQSRQYYTGSMLIRIHGYFLGFFLVNFETSTLWVTEMLTRDHGLYFRQGLLNSVFRSHLYQKLWVLSPESNHFV